MFGVVDEVYEVIDEVFGEEKYSLFRRNESTRNRIGKTTSNAMLIIGPKPYSDSLMSSTISE
jgi:hypothetical protein